MRALLIGAGAVGQTYGRHLQLGGAEVAFLVKPKYADPLRAGVPVYPLNQRCRRRTPVKFDGFGVLTSPGEVAASRWDQVWLCMSSTGLRGPWFDELVPAIGDATLVMLQPGLEDRAWILERVPAERLVQGLIALVSYHGPLPGETLPRPGVAYWFPPFSPSPFEGPQERTLAVVEALRAGGCPAKLQAGVVMQAAYGSSILMPHIAALEIAGWSFAGVRRGDHLRLAKRGSDQALAIAARLHGEEPPAARSLVQPFLTKVVTHLAPFLMPLEVETYLRVHFTKVGDQTRDHLRTLMGRGGVYGLPTDALEELLSRLPALSAG
jgi:2-dehydropantoate 2-reductase